MGKIWSYLRKHPLSFLLVALPLALIARYAGWSSILVFLLSAVGVIPMAGYIGEATEVLAEHTGPKIGGLLNATLGNAAELIITLVAIRAGLLELVKASITGSILGNLLLVMGMSMVVGGVRHGTQTFDRRQSGNHAILLTLSILALVIPSLFGHAMLGNSGSWINDETAYSIQIETLSLGVAVVMIVLYALGILYSLRSATQAHKSPLAYQEPQGHTNKKGAWSIRKAIIVLGLATFGVVILSEILVGAVESVVTGLGLSEFFLGIILIPIVGNVAEHLVAVQVAARNQMELSVEIAISSSLQIALFVAPLLVFISLLMGHPLTLLFNQFELLALGAGVLIAALVAVDGESNWLEGATLLAVYLMLGIAFFLLPV
jgi:Ca2+:H+ antiporter